MGRWFIAICGCALLTACGAVEQPADRPHILLISSDTLRADHLSMTGYPRSTSPAIDAFAASAWRFTDAVTVIPKTGPSLATLFTGLHPQQHGVRSNFEAIPADASVLAERLRDAGYATVAFVGNPALRNEVGFARGFDRYDLVDGRRGEGVLSVNADFLEWASTHSWQRPTFVWLHYMDPHGPYTPPEELERPFLEDELAASDLRVALEPRATQEGNPNKVLGSIPLYQQRDGEDRAAVYVARYDAEIRYMDAAFAEVIAFLESRELYDESAVVFTSDHGESLGEHDYWFEHGWFAFEPTLRVPLIIREPRQSSGRIESRQVSNLDLRPTLLALAKLGSEADAAGTNLLAPFDERGPLLIENSDRYPVKVHGVRVAGWKYLIREEEGIEELYDLSEDPAELHDLAGDEPERLAELRRACAEALERARARAWTPAAGPEDDPEMLERLRALGYVGQ